MRHHHKHLFASYLGWWEDTEYIFSFIIMASGENSSL